MKTVLFLVRSAPYGSAAIPEGARACLGFATMPLDLTFLLTEDAAWACAPDQVPESIQAPAVPALLETLLDADVKVAVDAEALSARGLDPQGLPEGVVAVSAAAIGDLVHHSDAILTY